MRQPETEQHQNSIIKQEIKTPQGYSLSLFLPKETKETADTQNVAVIVFSGAGDNAIISDSMSQSVAQELLAEETLRNDNHLNQMRLGWTLHMPSTVGMDVIESQQLSTKERIPSFVGAILSEIAKHPVRKVYLVGHSMGGQQLPQIVSELKPKLPEKTEIGGVVFFQSGGIFEQSVAEFSAGLLQSNKLEAEIKQVFPSIIDLMALKERVRQARESGDHGLAIKLTNQFEDMQKKYTENFALLKQRAIESATVTQEKLAGKKLPFGRINHIQIETYFKTLEQLNMDLENQVLASHELYSPKKIKNIEQLRLKLIMKIIKHLTADPHRGDPWKPLAVYLNSGKEAFFSPHPIINKLSPEQTEAFDFPVTVLWSENDTVFPEQKAKSRTGNLKKIFPHAKNLYEATINSWGHKPHPLIPEQFGKIIADMVSRMHDDPEENETVSLKY